MKNTKAKNHLTRCYPEPECLKATNNGSRTSCRPIRSVIIPVITKSGDLEAEVRFVNHEYGYRPNWTPLSPVIN